MSARLTSSLQTACERLVQLQSVPEDSDDEDMRDHSHGMIQLLAKSNQQPSRNYQNVPSRSDNVAVNGEASQGSPQTSTLPPSKSAVGVVGYESLVRYPQLIQLCKTLMKKLEEIDSKLEVVGSDLDKRRSILEQFWTGITALSTWISTTGQDHSNMEVNSLSIVCECVVTAASSSW